MAWTDAARRASAEARRRKAEFEGNFHYYGTPKFDPFYVKNDYRRRLAAKMRTVRHQIHSARGFSDSHDRNKMQETMREAAYAKGQRIMARSQGAHFGPHEELVAARAENIKLFNAKKKGWSDAARAAALEARRRKNSQVGPTKLRDVMGRAAFTEKDFKVGARVSVGMGYDTYNGTVSAYHSDIKNGTPGIDYTRDNGEKHWAYLDQVKGVQGPSRDMVRKARRMIRLENKKAVAAILKPSEPPSQPKKSAVQSLDEKRMKARLRRQARADIRRMRTRSYQQHDSTGE